MTLNELQQNVDYFYCVECKKHIPCIRLEQECGKSSVPAA